MNLPGAFPTATFSSEVARFPASVATTFSKATVLTNAFAPNKPGRQHSGMEKFAGISVNHVKIGISFHLFGSKMAREFPIIETAEAVFKIGSTSNKLLHYKAIISKIQLCHHLPLTLLHTCCMSCHFWESNCRSMSQ